MGDHQAVFRSLQELFPQVDPRILKAVAIEHHNDVDSAVVAVLDEVMPSVAVTGSGGASSGHQEFVPPMPACIGESFARVSRFEIGSSSSAGHDTRADEVNGSIHSAHSKSSAEFTTDMQENVAGELDAGMLPSYQQMSEQPNVPTHPVPELNDNKRYSTSDLGGRLPSYQQMSEQTNVLMHTVPELNDNNQRYSTSDLGGSYLNPCSPNFLSRLDNGVGCDGFLSSEYLAKSLTGESVSASITLNAAEVKERDSDKPVPIGDCVAQDTMLNLSSDYVDINGVDIFLSKFFAGVSNNEVSSGVLSADKDDFVPTPTTKSHLESSVGPSGEQKDTSCTESDYNDKQQSGNVVEDPDIIVFESSITEKLVPDLNLDHFAPMASTHSSHSVSIESLDDSILGAKSNKNDLLPSLELVTKMIDDVEILEEKAKVAKYETSIAGTSILGKVEELKEMLKHAKEANDMHACEVFGEKSILTTEARELQSRLQRLSEEKNSYLVVIDEIHRTLEERLVVAQQEIEAAEKEKIEKETSAHALLDDQEKEMNSIVEESRKLQKEAEENLKLKDFLVERGQIVDTLQGEMAVICEDVSQLKRIVDDRLSFSKLQRSTISSLSSSLHSSLNRSVSSADGAIEVIESTDKHTVAEGAGPVVGDLNGDERNVQVLDGTSLTDQDNSKPRDSNEDGWEFC